MSWDNSKAAVLRRRAERLRKLQEAADGIVRRLSARPDIVRILAFGSFARGEAGSRSDLDLVVIQETKQPFFDRLDDIYRDVSTTVDVDILVYTPEEWTRLVRERPFLARVAREGKVLYERDRDGGGEALDRASPA